ncbi:P-loop containing nucleoside triphosphate hydrolase protein [Blastocladiella britannica]|nr:P-loop containing nucleoside triphosphate hydrolase protein [Blastocladiella britannica]
MAANFFTRTAARPKGSTESAPATLQPWVEKYRPNSIDDISSQGQVVNVLRRAIETQNLPHLLFYGPPGTGKTSTILALSKELFGPELYRTRVLELNASDERGISVVRDKIKNFARTVVSRAPENSTFPVPPYKIIILDEADSMTPDAQAALRRVIENHSSVTRFCLICNYVTRIIEPLASRCAKFRFVSLEAQEIKNRLRFICDKENVKIDDTAIEAMMQVSEGDMRKAVMFLQSASRLAGEHAPITAAMVRDLAGVVPPETVTGLVSLWHAQPPAPYEQVVRAIQDVVADGWAATQVVSQLYSALLDDERLSSIQKAKLAVVFGRVDHCLSGGADEALQLMDLVLEGCRIARGLPAMVA